MRAHRRLKTVVSIVVVVLGAGLPVHPHPAGAVIDPVLVGAGDIAFCGNTNDSMTANVLDTVVATHPTATVFTTGDSVYPDGTINEFANCYDPTWGRHRDRTRPAPGNHDYNTPGAAPYFAYFGAAAGDPATGYYSYDLGTWHVVVLNSICVPAGGCGPGSPQLQWLRADLAASEAECTVAYWHHPRFSSSSQHGSDPTFTTFWEVLHEHGADLVLNGHDHVYERFAPQNPAGDLDLATGIRQFTVGTGGRSTYPFGTALPNSEVRATPFGVLELTLHDGSYSWEFHSILGQTFTDAGTGDCHGAPPPSPDSLSFEAEADARVVEASPDSNFGLSPALEADNSPVVESYLRFAVTGVGAPPMGARLRLFVTNGSGDGPRAFRAGNGWSEPGITWNNRPPPLSGTLSDLGSVSSGGFVDFDVSAVVTGNGTYTFGLAGTSNDGTDFSSREAAENPPMLLIDAPFDAPVRAIAAAATTPSDNGYWLVDDVGQVTAFGEAPFLGSLVTPPAMPIAGMAATPTGEGYWLVDAAGEVYPFGDADFLGSMGGIPLNRPVVGMEAAADGSGYWLVASDGGVFSFGVPFFGSRGGQPLNRPVVGMGAHPGGSGYWLVASDGGVFSYGVPFFGSTGNLVLNQPVMAMEPAQDGDGYWLVAADGGVFSFGVPFFGSTGGMPPGESVVGMEGTTTGAGYWITTTAGEVFAFGDAEVLPAA